MKVTPLPFDHSKDNYTEAIGITNKMIDDFVTNTDVHTRVLVACIAENRPVDPFMLRHACSYFVTNAKENLSLANTPDTEDVPTVKALNATTLCALTFGLDHDKVSEVVEHVERNFIRLYDEFCDEGVTSRLGILCVLSCYNIYIME